MTPEECALAVARLRLALDLAATAEELMRARLARENPHWSAVEIEQRIIAWYGERPGAEFGDADGTPCSWPRSR